MSSAQCLIFSRRKLLEVVYSSSDTCLLCPGKVPRIRGKLVHFPGVLIDREACMSVVLECSRGKCLEFAAIWFTFPESAGKVRIKGLDDNENYTETASLRPRPAVAAAAPAAGQPPQKKRPGFQF